MRVLTERDPVMMNNGDLKQLKDVGSDSYILPKATANTLGGVKVGDNLTIEDDGTLNAEGYTLPPATSETLGGVKAGDNVTIEEDGTLNAEGYTLPPATSETLGGVKVGENLTIGEDGTLNAEGGTDFIFEPVTLTPLAGVSESVSNTYFAFRLGDVLYFSISIVMASVGANYVDVFTVEGNNEFTATTSGVSFNAPAMSGTANAQGAAYRATIAGRHDNNILTIYNDNSGAYYVSAWGALPLKPRS